MKVAFDHQIFTFQEYGGVSRYVCQLAANLARQPDIEAKIFAPLHVNAYLDDMDPNLVSGRRMRSLTRTGNKYLSIAASKLFVIPQLRSFRPDIIHETYYSRLCYKPKGARRVITVYDMIHEKLPGMSSSWRFTNKRKREAVLRADHVICISHATRKDLLEFIPVPEDKVSVVHLGFSIQHHQGDQAKNNFDIVSSPFILYVGSRAGYKNFSGSIRAFASSPMLKENFKFVCFGGGKATSMEMTMLRELKLPADAVHFIQGSDALLAEVYANARLFIYPSIYEGFGLPPLEAMSYGCPVVCSNSSSIPEVVGDAGGYFDPDDLASIRMALENVALSDEKCADLVTAGYRRLDFFSWEKCAAETLSIYRNLLD